MNNLAIPLSGVDALHAHFAEWVKFLDSKGSELEAQLAKLEARKAHTTASDSQFDLRGSGYLELAFGDQLITSKRDSTPAADDEDTEPAIQVDEVLPEEMAYAEAEGQTAEEANEVLQTEHQASAEPPNPMNTEGQTISPGGYWVNP